MFVRSPRRTLVAVALLAVLVVSSLPAAAMPLGVRNLAPAAPSVAEGLLERLWRLVHGLAGLTKAGASIDPDGHSVTPPPAPGGDAGASIDPDGIRAAGGGGVIADPEG
jgi:hypothetical protein